MPAQAVCCESVPTDTLHYSLTHCSHVRKCRYPTAPRVDKQDAHPPTLTGLVLRDWSGRHKNTADVDVFSHWGDISQIHLPGRDGDCAHLMVDGVSRMPTKITWAQLVLPRSALLQ